MSALLAMVWPGMVTILGSGHSMEPQPQSKSNHWKGIGRLKSDFISYKVNIEYVYSAILKEFFKQYIHCHIYYKVILPSTETPSSNKHKS
jgi:hypothetical protein